MNEEDQATAERSPARKPRSDGLRNRERLIEAAKAGFAATGPEVSLEEIARRAGVGIGTLYRHFPTRETIVAAVYRHEVEQLAESAERLLASTTPGEALHQWLLLCVDYLATKKVIVQALSASAVSEIYAASGAPITETITLLTQRARASGDIRSDADPDDLMRALIGFTYGASDPAWATSARRLIDILMDGLRAR